MDPNASYEAGRKSGEAFGWLIRSVIKYAFVGFTAKMALDAFEKRAQ